MLGGGPANWHNDGAVMTLNDLGDADPSVARYDSDEPGKPVTDITKSTSNMALKAVPNKASQELAEGKAKLFITGNTAERGGGIAANGAGSIGTPGKQTVSIKVNKAWNMKNAPQVEHPKSATVWLVIDGKRVESVELSEKNGWTHTFTGLPEGVNATIEEDQIEGYDTTIIGNASDGFTVTNTVKPQMTSIDVEKRWVGGTGADSVTIHLLADGKDTGKSLILNADGGWKGTFADLPVLGEDGKKIAYTVSEDKVEGYDVAITGNASAGFTVTNTKQEKRIPPTSPKHKETPPQTGDPIMVMPLAILAGLGVSAILSGIRKEN